MNCEQAQDAILQVDDPATITTGDSELAHHVAQCAVCQLYVKRMMRLEDAAGRLPLPAGSEMAKARVMKAVGATVRRRHFFLHPRWLTAAAAMLLVGIGL